MTHEPRRLRDVGSKKERELLGAIRNARIPSGAREETWAKLALQLGASAAITTTALTSAASQASLASGTAAAVSQAHAVAVASSASTAAVGAQAVAVATTGAVSAGWFAKGVTFVALASAVVAPVAAWTSNSEAELAAPSAEEQEPPAQPALKIMAITDLALAPSAEDTDALSVDPAKGAEMASSGMNEQDVARSSSERAKQARAATTSNVPEPAAVLQRLTEESAALGRVRAQLQSGDASGALRALDQLEHNHPSPVLTQERQILRIEALAAAGQKGAAERLASRFLKAYPKSPHSSRAERVLKR